MRAVRQRVEDLPDGSDGIGPRKGTDPGRRWPAGPWRDGAQFGSLAAAPRLTTRTVSLAEPAGVTMVNRAFPFPAVVGTITAKTTVPSAATVAGAGTVHPDGTVKVAG